MQPYFFPYLGYYSLIKHTDSFVFLDTVQFIRHGWIERNRILKPGDGWQYIAVPLEKHSRDTLIRDITIRVGEQWQEKIIRQIEHYKKRAPFYKDVTNLVAESISDKSTSIVQLNARILSATCAYLDIPIRLSIFSEMQLTIETVNDAGEWALQISKAVGAKEYVNPIGGVELFKPGQFRELGITLSFLSNSLSPYNQRRPTFEPGLSIIDVMMFNDPVAANKLIDDVQVVSSNDIKNSK